MSNWQKGDLAVAKTCAHFPACKVCGEGLEIHARQYYRVEDVDSALFGGTGEMMDHLDVGLKCACQDLDYYWPHVFFEKIVPATEDIFKLAEAPKPLVEQEWR